MWPFRRNRSNPKGSRRQFSLLTWLVFCVAAGLLLGVGGPPLWKTVCGFLPRRPEVGPTRIITAKTIRSPSELDAALSHPRVILHVDVEWSMTAVLSRPFVFRLRERLEADPQLKDVVFRRIDCTHQEGEVWDALGKWLREHGRYGSVMSNGNGDTVWINNGKIVDHVGFPGGEDDPSIFDRTRRAFGK